MTIIKILIIPVVSLFVLFLVSFFKLPFNDRLAEIFFAICGVLFSVGMCQVMVFDFSKIVDTETYERGVKGLGKVRLSFVIQFTIASISFVVLQIFKSGSINVPSLCVKGRSFSVEVFCNLIIIYSLFFFLYNFYILANKKSALDKIYRDEAMEDLE